MSDWTKFAKLCPVIGEHNLLDHREAVVAIDGQLARQMLQMRLASSACVSAA